MRLLFSLLLLAPIAMSGGHDTVGSLPNSGASAGGDKGCPDDSCWKDTDGNNVKVDVRGTTFGDQKVKVSKGSQCSLEATGTPASDGGCRESAEMSCGGDTYRIKGGKLQQKQDDGSFKSCSSDKSDNCQGGDEVERR